MILSIVVTVTTSSIFMVSIFDNENSIRNICNTTKDVSDGIINIYNIFNNISNNVEKTGRKIFCQENDCLCKGQQELYYCNQMDLKTIFGTNIPLNNTMSVLNNIETKYQCSGMCSKLSRFYFSNIKFNNKEELLIQIVDYLF